MGVASGLADSSPGTPQGESLINTPRELRALPGYGLVAVIRQRLVDGLAHYAPGKPLGEILINTPRGLRTPLGSSHGTVAG